jgi:hypothetical protein
VVILLMIIGGYSIVAISGFFIMAISGYFIDGCWWLF